jgi:hypothetical protein
MDNSRRINPFTVQADKGAHIMKYILTIALVLIAGCSTNPKNIDAAYVSPGRYSSYDCHQLHIEMEHVTRKTTDLYASLKKRNKKDKWMMGVGMVIFWPTLFALSGGDSTEANQYAQLQGEEEAIRTAMVRKNCQLPPTVNETILETTEDPEPPQQETQQTDPYEAIKARPQRSYLHPQKLNVKPLKYSALRDGKTVVIK